MLLVSTVGFCENYAGGIVGPVYLDQFSLQFIHVLLDFVSASVGILVGIAYTELKLLLSNSLLDFVFMRCILVVLKCIHALTCYGFAVVILLCQYLGMQFMWCIPVVVIYAA